MSNELAEKQVKVINERLESLQMDRTIKVEINEVEHYLSHVTETGAVYLDGSHFEGDLEEMTFLDMSPDDGVDFEDLSKERFDQLIKEIFNDKNIVDLVLVITEADHENEEISYGEIDYNLEKNEAYLIGYFCEKGKVEEYPAMYARDHQRDQYIAQLEWDRETERYKVLGYHSDILKRIERRKEDIKEIDLIAQYPHRTTIYTSRGIEVKFQDRKDITNRSYEAFTKMIVNFARALKNRGFQIELIDDLTIDIRFEEDTKK